ncbi:MAG: glutathione S-transferase family protein [Pseudomonadota bacterium]
MVRLYHLALSPFCRKIRMLLSEKGVEARLIDEKPWERRADFLALSPGAEIPVLVTEDGVAISDSVAIAEYLDEEHPAPPVLPPDIYQRAEARRLAQWFDVKFNREVTENLLNERIFKQLRGDGHPDSARIRAGTTNIRLHLEYIDWLADNRRWLAGDALSIADFAAAAHLSALDYAGDVPWRRASPAKLWYARMKSRPSFRDLLADRVPGISPAPHYTDLDF